MANPARTVDSLLRSELYAREDALSNAKKDFELGERTQEEIQDYKDDVAAIVEAIQLWASVRPLD